jgi:hypothetical protein
MGAIFELLFPTLLPRFGGGFEFGVEGVVQLAAGGDFGE